MRAIELVSGLKINFNKSNVSGVRVGDWLLNSSTLFLGCKRGVISFRILGIMVGVNPRRKKVWLKVVNDIKKDSLLGEGNLSRSEEG